MVLFIFSLFFVSVFGVPVQSQCEEYISLAEEKLAPPYPNYFGAAGEFQHAADCYDEFGETALAQDYHEKSATHFVQAAEQLVVGGDYYQRAKSYEFAGDEFLKIGDKNNAMKYYKMSEEAFEEGGYSNEAFVMSGKATGIFEEPGGTSLWVWIMAALILIVFVVYGIYSFARKGGLPTGHWSERSGYRPSKPSKPSKFGPGEFKRVKREDFMAPRVEEPEPSEPEPEPETSARMTPKEKLAKKLREKYTPKEL